jgi:ABC-type branched-subunit amino acid transport system substrate-binding protein
MRPARFLAVLLALSVTAACGSTVQGSRQVAGGGAGGLDGTAAADPGLDATGEAATDAGATGSAGGASAKGPVEIGMVRTGVSNAAAFGASLGNTVSEAEIYNALIAAMNDQGGLAGRRIRPVFADTDTASANWDADFEAACAKFTQDNKVVAVLGYVFNHSDNFEGCLAKRGIPHLSTTFNVPDAAVLQQYPLLVALTTPRIERRSLVKIDGGLATGVLTKASKLGVLIDSCPGTKRAWTDVALPYLRSKGLTVASTAELGCAKGSGDAGAEAGRAGNVILQFRSEGVDTIFIAAVSEGPGVLVFANAAEAQGWHPKYVVSSLANAAVLESQIPAGQAANLHGYGWLPSQDVAPTRWPAQPAPAERCIALVTSKGIKLQAPADFAFAFNGCEGLFAYEAALKATGGRTDGPAVVSAIEGFGSGYTSVMNLDGRMTFGPERHDGPSLARYFAWDGGCSCFTYRPTTLAIQ